MSEALSTRTCGNCGERIGALETALEWKAHVVCARCHAKLTGAAMPATPDAQAARAVTGVWREIKYVLAFLIIAGGAIVIWQVWERAKHESAVVDEDRAMEEYRLHHQFEGVEPDRQRAIDEYKVNHP